MTGFRDLITVGGHIVGIGGKAIRFPAVIRETFNKADGSLGPELSWQNVVFPHIHQFHVVSNQAQLDADEAGSFEAFARPTPNIDDTNDVEVSLNVTGLTRGLGTSAPEYVIDVGSVIRAETRLGGANYRSYACGIGRSNIFIPPGHTWHLALFRVDGLAIFNDGLPVLLDIALLNLAQVTLPGTFTMRAVGPNIRCTFEHAGSGGTMEVTATDSTYASGFLGLGGSVVLEDDTDVGTIIVDNFQARALPAGSTA